MSQERLTDGLRKVNAVLRPHERFRKLRIIEEDLRDPLWSVRCSTLVACAEEHGRRQVPMLPWLGWSCEQPRDLARGSVEMI